MHDCPDCRHLEHELEEVRHQLEQAREELARTSNLLASGEALRQKMLFQSIVNPPGEKGKRIDILAGRRAYSPVMGLHTQEERDQASILMRQVYEAANDDFVEMDTDEPVLVAIGYMMAIRDLADDEDAIGLREEAEGHLRSLEFLL